MNAISPELALIDPALRRADIARLAAHPPAFAVARLRTQAEVAPVSTFASPTAVGARNRARRAVRLALLLGLFAAGVVLATLVAQNHPAAGPVLLTRPVIATSSASESGPLYPTTTAATDAAVLERELLVQIVQSPSRLPRALIDPSTGLARNNLQAKCRSALPSGYLCVVRPAQHKAGEGLHVRYGPSGFTWYPYRSG
jgi:hypothetical protein